MVRLLITIPLLACATLTQTGSMYRGRCLHIGARPGDGFALSIQVTTDAPLCKEIYPSR
jgi:hypothetical protein